MKESYRFNNVMKLVLSLRVYWRDLTLTLLSVLVKHMATLGAALSAAKLVSLAMEEELKESYLPILIFLCACVVLRGIAHFGEMVKGHDGAYKIQRDKRIGLYVKFESLAPAYMSRRHSGQVAATAMGDIELLEWFLAHTLGSMIMSVLITILMAVLLFQISPVLAALVLLFGLIIGGAPQIFYKESDKQGRVVRNLNSRSNAVIMEGIQGMRDIMAMDYLDQWRSKHDKCLSDLYGAQISYAGINAAEHGVMTFFSGAFIVVIMIYTANLIGTGQMEASMYPLVLVLSALIFNPIIELTNYARNLGITFAAASRIQEIYDAQAEVKDEGWLKETPESSHDLSFEHVTFGYEKEKEPVLKDVSFQVPVGSMVALVGPSGVGKTTCINLLLRYWNPDSGCIRIGGEDISHYTLDHLHEMISAVMQDVFLFHTSIRENILLGKKDASEEEMIQAAKQANAHEYIMGLPEGYDTIIGEQGYRLSGGQRQRIAIARALLQNAPILVLDEAVSSLDAENEQLIQKVLEEHSANRTTLVIAHRLSTIVRADLLLVMKEGRIVQMGTHEELIQKEGFYRELMSHQM